MKWNAQTIGATALAVLAVVVAVVVVWQLRSGGSNDQPNYTAEELVAKVQAAVIVPGMVFHATGDDGSQVWLDPSEQKFRRQESADRGGLTSIGDGWTRYSYDPFNNVVNTDDLSPGSQTPRINDPAAPWWEPLTALAYGVELNVIGYTTSDGRVVIALESQSPILDSSGNLSGNYLQGRIELDPKTFIPVTFEQTEVVAPGGTASEATPAQARIKYTYEIAPLANVPAGFFDRSIVDDLVQSVEENLQGVRDLGLTPYWLGETYVGPGGPMKVPDATALIVDDTNARRRSTIRTSQG